MEKRLQTAQDRSRDIKQKANLMVQEEMMVVWPRLVVVGGGSLPDLEGHKMPTLY